MSLTFQCPHCACAYALDDSFRGTPITCRRCGQEMQAPGSPLIPAGKLSTSLPPNLNAEENDMPLLTPAPTRYLNQITRHLDRTIGPSPMVFHEIISTDIHLDLHIVPPRPEPTAECPAGHNFYTIVTSGMSARPMTLPPEAHPDSPRFAELMISLPADWPGLRPDGTFVQEYMHDEANWWPLRWLKMLARMPHEHATAVGPGHTIPNGESAEPFSPDTRFGCMLLLPSLLHPQADRLVVHDDITIQFLSLWPIYPEEMAYKLRHGTAALQAAFARHGITDLVDLHRPNVACTA